MTDARVEQALLLAVVIAIFVWRMYAGSRRLRYHWRRYREHRRMRTHRDRFGPPS